jgi:hypothetical protein
MAVTEPGGPIGMERDTIVVSVKPDFYAVLSSHQYGLHKRVFTVILRILTG